MSGADLVVLLLALGWAASLAVAWWRFLGGTHSGESVWRRRVFLLGVMANTLSMVLLVAFTLQAVLVWKGILGARDLVRVYKFFVPLGLCAVTVVCGAFGRGAPRILVVLNGFVLAYLWLNYGAISL